MKLCSIIILVFALCVPAFGSQPLSLEQCIVRGLRANPVIRAYRIAVQEAGEGIREAWGAFLPTLSLNYGRNQLVNNNGGEERDTDYLDQTSNSFTCRLTQPIFTGFSGVAGLKKARHSKAYRENELRFMEQQLVREIRASFYDILRASELVDKWSGSVRRLEEQREIVAAWCAQELAPRLRLLEVGVELSNARQEVISAKSRLAIARAGLREWLALEQEEPLAIAGSLEDVPLPSCPNMGDCLETALVQRPEMPMTALNVEMARQDVRIIAGRNLPRVEFDAGWTDYDRDYDDERYGSDIRNYYSLTLNISLKPFQGGRNIFAWRQKRLAVKRFQSQRVKEQSAIVTDVKTRYQQFKEAESGLTAARDTLSEAREAYKVASRSVELGVSSLRDLLDAELRLTNAEINMIETRHALQMARIQLEYAVGN